MITPDDIGNTSMMTSTQTTATSTVVFDLEANPCDRTEFL